MLQAHSNKIQTTLKLYTEEDVLTFSLDNLITQLKILQSYAKWFQMTKTQNKNAKLLRKRNA